MTEPEPDDDTFTCWCGATGKASEMFSPVERTCGGTGIIRCICGGDFCCCHNHGEIECDGCEDCEPDEDDWDDDPYDHEDEVL